MDGAANVGETERGDAAIQYGALQHGHQRAVDRGVVFSHLGRGKYQ